MYLRCIHLENYRRFKWAELEFPDGIVGIIGNNGAGKSTLMEAIAWALFGTDASRTSKDQIKSVFAGKPEVCRVILDFEMNGDNFQAVRELKGASHSVDASVIINKKVAARGNTAVNELIQKTLDMDYRAFMTSFYAKQRELNALSDFQPFKRKELLARMLSIETVDGALKNLRSDKRELEIRLDISRSRVKDKDELDTRKKEKSENLVVLREKFETAREKLTLEGSALGEMEKLWERVKSKYKQHVHLGQKVSVAQMEIQGLQAQMKSQEEEKGNLTALVPKEKRLKELLLPYEEVKKRISSLEEQRIKGERRKVTESQIEEAETSISSNRGRLASIIKELEPRKEIDETLKQVTAKLDRQDRELEETRSLYMKTEASFRSLQDEKSRLVSQLEHIESLGPDSVCDRCLRPMGPDYNRIREHLVEEQKQLENKLQSFGKEKEEIKRKGQDLKKAKLDLESQKEKLQRSLERFSRLEGERQSLESGLKEKEQSLSSLRGVLENLGEVKYDSAYHQQAKAEFERLDEVRHELTELTSQLKRLPLVEKSINEVKEKMRSLRRESEKLNEDISMLGFSEEEYKSVEQKLGDKRKEIHSLELTLKDVGHQEEMIEKEIDRIEQELKDARKLEKDIRIWEEERRYLEKLDLLLTDFRISLIGRIRPTLSRHASTLFLDLCENRYENLRLDEDYEIFIQDQGEEFPISRFSGGEIDLANLCLRIAISLLISESSQVGFSFIILDEIFGSQDVLRKENILNALARLKNRFRQIFLITHIDDIKDSVENLVYVTENEDGTSELVLQ
jgi:exonuclease SbcC